MKSALRLGRTVLAWFVFALCAIRADICFRRSYLLDLCLVQDRDRDLRDAGVVLADVADGGLVLNRRARVLRALALVGRAGRGERVVERRVRDAVLADLAAPALERQLGAVLDCLGLVSRSSLLRQTRIDGQ